MSKKNDNLSTEMVDTPVDPTAILAEVYKKEDGFYIRNVSDGVEQGPCQVTKEDYLVFPKNDANRKYLKVNVAEEGCKDGKVIGLTYKATKHFGSVISTRRIPNAALLQYLSEEEQAEVKAMFDKAYDAMAADKASAKPATDREKIAARIAKLQAQLAELEAADVSDGE